MEAKEIGFLGENLAARFLESKGCQIISRNYRKPWGEIDIVAKDGEVYCFVEVKSNSKKYVSGFEPEIRADGKKLKKVVRTAELFMDKELNLLGRAEWRLDVISVVFNKEKQKATIKHFKNITF